ncbi:MAG TPA: hypothetical protein VMU81_27925 [Acetobacteraceae bacterium]|nr:hypothetical protein [Acetobacteraceae bacterium]
MGAPLHRRTEEIGACLADPFANGEGAKEIDTFTIPDGAGGGSISPIGPLKDRRTVLSSKMDVKWFATWVQRFEALSRRETTMVGK